MVLNTSAAAAFNGWQSASFPERSGVQQGTHCHPSHMFWQPNLWPVTSGIRRRAAVQPTQRKLCSAGYSSLLPICNKWMQLASACIPPGGISAAKSHQASHPPHGQPAPVSHQHADDTTFHVLRPSYAQAALDSSIALCSAATCSPHQANHSDDVALAQDYSQGSVQLPSAALGLHCSQGSSPAPCPCPRGMWGLCMC